MAIYIELNYVFYYGIKFVYNVVNVLKDFRMFMRFKRGGMCGVVENKGGKS